MAVSATAVVVLYSSSIVLLYCPMRMIMMMRMMMLIAVTEMRSDTTDVWSLKFTSLQPDDFGLYTCEASNDLDTDVGQVILSR